MKVKAVIMRPDRTNDVVIVRKKRIEGKTFRHAGVTYFLHPDRAQITWVKKLFGLLKFYYGTYYFTQGISNPLPVPNFTQLIKSKTKLADHELEYTEEIGRNGSSQLVKKKVQITNATEAEFKDVVDLGTSGEELAAIFNPWFYRIIAPMNNLRNDLMFYLLIAACCGLAYIIYMLHSGNIVVSTGLPPPPPPAPVTVVP